jgi:hypothetical protein
VSARGAAALALAGLMLSFMVVGRAEALRAEAHADTSDSRPWTSRSLCPDAAKRRSGCSAHPTGLAWREAQTRAPRPAIPNSAMPGREREQLLDKFPEPKSTTGQPAVMPREVQPKPKPRKKKSRAR